MIHWNFKKITTAFLTTLGIGTLTSCYGMPMTDYGSEWSGNVYGGEGTELPLKDIKATLKNGDEVVKETSTDEDGYFAFYMESGAKRTTIIDPDDYLTDFSITLTDADGEANGGKFKEQTIQNVRFSYSDTQYKEIHLEKDEVANTSSDQ